MKTNPFRKFIFIPFWQEEVENNFSPLVTRPFCTAALVLWFSYFDVVIRVICGVRVFIYFNKLYFYDLCVVPYIIDMKYSFFSSNSMMAQQIKDTESMT